MKMKSEENDYDVKDVLGNGDCDLLSYENQDLSEIVEVLKKTKQLLQDLVLEMNRRLEESWYDQQVSFILYEVNTAQDKLENYIKKESISSNQISHYNNPKLEPIEGTFVETETDLTDDKNNILNVAEEVIKLEVDEPLEDLEYDDPDYDYEPNEKKSPSTPQKSNKYECLICGKSFTASGTLQKHYKSHGEGPYNCLECDKSFAEIHHLNRHYHNHASVQARNVNKIQYIKCMFCEEILLGNYNLKIHYKTHGDGPYTCTGCDVKVETLKEMREHMKKSHSHHRCVVCEENFTSFKLMIAHRKTHGSGPFKCKLCEKVKKNISILVKHMKRHAENDIVQCKVCSKKISSNKLKDHMGYHTGEDMDECEICYKSHPKAFMKIHMKFRHMSGVNKFYCKYCTASFTEEDAYSQHMKKHSGEKTHFCKLCEKSFFHPNQLKNHLFRIHQVGDRERFKCNLCDKRFVSRAFLTYHVRSHTGEKPYPCDTCGKAFRTSAMRNVHMKTHTGERPFSCDQCGNTFVQSAHLRTHKRFVHDGEKHPKPTPVICGTCGKQFYNERNLKNHEMEHFGGKPFKCEHCDKSFALVHTLNSHLKTHLELDELKRLTCDQCGKVYGSKGALKLHIKNIHESTGKHPCTICSKEFTRRENMLRHIKDIHEGIKNYKCEVCSQAFANSTVLKQHMRVHTGEKPFQCEVCNKSFTQYSSLYSHKKKGCS